MRILHILDHSLPKQSGYVYRTMSIMAAQKAMGWDPVLVTTPRQGATSDLAETVDGWRIYRTPNTGFAAKFPAGLRDALEMRQTASRLGGLIEEVKPDLLHAHSPVLNFFPANWVRGNLPLVYEVRAFWEDAAVDHGSTREGSLRYRISRAMETRAFRQATAVTTICEGLRADIVARGIPSGKVTVIPNAVDTEKFPPIEEKDLGLQADLGFEGKTVLGFIGSFYAYEGLEFLVRALPRILDMVPNAALLLVGGGPREAALKETARELGLTDHIRFTGRVPHAEVRRYYSLCDIMVYPRHSIRLTETVTPLKPLEAMSMKRLVLASDIGGHRELIEEGKTGRLFRADDAADLARVCADLVSHKNQWPDILQAGRDFVTNVRNWRTSVARYRAVYETCLSGHGKGAR